MVLTEKSLPDVETMVGREISSGNLLKARLLIEHGCQALDPKDSKQRLQFLFEEVAICRSLLSFLNPSESHFDGVIRAVE